MENELLASCTDNIAAEKLKADARISSEFLELIISQA